MVLLYIIVVHDGLPKCLIINELNKTLNICSFYIYLSKNFTFLVIYIFSFGRHLWIPKWTHVTVNKLLRKYTI